MLQELTAMTPTTAYTTSNDDPQTSSSWTAKFASVELDGVNILTEDVYTISSSPPWRPFVLIHLFGPIIPVVVPGLRGKVKVTNYVLTSNLLQLPARSSYNGFYFGTSAPTFLPEEWIQEPFS